MWVVLSHILPCRNGIPKLNRLQALSDHTELKHIEAVVIPHNIVKLLGFYARFQVEGCIANAFLVLQGVANDRSARIKKLGGAPWGFIQHFNGVFIGVFLDRKSTRLNSS